MMNMRSQGDQNGAKILRLPIQNGDTQTTSILREWGLFQEGEITTYEKIVTSSQFNIVFRFYDKPELYLLMKRGIRPVFRTGETFVFNPKIRVFGNKPDDKIMIINILSVEPPSLYPE